MTAEPSEEAVDPRTVTRPVKLPQAGLEPNTGEPFTYFPLVKPKPNKKQTQTHGY